MASPTRDSNLTQLRVARETIGDIGVLPANPTWYPLEPNSYSDFGAQVGTMARQPIAADRQLNRQAVVSLNAAAGYQTDLTPSLANDRILESVFAAHWRRKTRPSSVGAVASSSTITLGALNAEAITFRVTLSGINAGSPFDVVGGYGDDVDDLGADMAALLNADAALAGITYTPGTRALLIPGGGGNNTGDDTITADYRVGGISLIRTAMSITAPGAAGADRTIVLAGPAHFFKASDIIAVQGCVTAANNQGAVVTAITSLTDLLTLTDIDPAVGDPGFVVEAAPPDTARVYRVGFQSAAGDVDVSVAGSVYTLTSTVLDFTSLGLIVGEWVFLGGDGALAKFLTTANNGFARVRAVAANVLTLDKTQDTMATEANTTQLLHLYFGDFLRNEPDPADIVKRTLQFERDLGDPGFEYAIGQVPSVMRVNLAANNKAMIDLTFIGTDTETAAAAKAGDRPDAVLASPFNTASDFSWLRLQRASNEALVEANLIEASLEINNNPGPVAALSSLGPIDVTLGFFQVTGRIVAVFTTTDAIDFVRDNIEATFAFGMVRENEGVLVDIPSMGLGDGRLSIAANQAITIPLAIQANKSAAPFGYTMLWDKFWFLPDLAETFAN